MTFILVDFSNLAFRVKHATRGDADTKGALSLHACFASIAKVWRMFEGSHVVVAREGGNVWRKDHLQSYKIERQVKMNLRTRQEIEEDEIFYEYITAFSEFLENKSNVSLIMVPRTEADDVIARWIQLHPEDDHVIVSNDTDFYQLLSPNVKIYRAQMNETVTLEGVFDDKGEPVIDKKTKQAKPGPDPEWELFKKVLRGDPGDGVGRACIKGMREKKLREAYDNRLVKGFDWNNVMLQEWEDPDGGMRTVESRFKDNKVLIDLTKQPQEIKAALDAGIIEVLERPKIPAAKIGFNFMKFCDEYDLVKIAENAENYTAFLKAAYGEK